MGTLVISAALLFKIKDISESGDTKQDIEQAIKPYLNTLVGLNFVSLTLGPAVYWIFAVKYWSIALKFELAMKD